MYKYDPAGTNPDNVIVERFCISSTIPGMQAWVPHGAPFFTKDMKIRNLFTRELLTYGKDFVFSDDLTMENKVAESNIYNTVLFIGDTPFGMYESEYRTVGGGLVHETRSYMIKLALRLVEPVKVIYSYVTNIPPAFPPDHHLHDWSDYRNKQYIATALSAITLAVRESDNQGIDNLGPLQKEIEDVGKYMDAINLSKHTSEIDAHHTRARDTNALPAGTPAKDAMRLFDNTLSELVAYVKTEQKQGVEFEDYVDSTDTTNIVKSIILSQQAEITTPGGETGMRVVGDNVFYESLGSVDFTSHVDNLGALIMRAGRNVLEIRSIPYGHSVDVLYYNGIPVITAENIKSHMDTIVFDEQTIVTRNNDVAITKGDGSTQNPISVDVILQDATELQAGVAKFTRDWGQDKYLVMESDLIKGLITNLSGYVPRERKINGFSITDNIVIPASDPNINLGNVDNTADTEKPVSTAQKALLDTYADALHSHPYTAPTASSSTVGIAKLNTSWTGSEVGFVSPSAFAFIDDALTLSHGMMKMYNGEAMDPDAIYAVIRDVPTIKRGRAITLGTGEPYLVIK